VLRQVFAAVLVAAAIIAALVVITRMMTAAVFGMTPSMPPPASYLVINVLASMVAAGLGGYVCMRRAPAGRVLFAAALLVALFMVAGYFASKAAATPSQPLWFQALATLLGVSGLFCGFVIGASRRAKA
jgi:hypothetical protein